MMPAVAFLGSKLSSDELLFLENAGRSALAGEIGDRVSALASEIGDRVSALAFDATPYPAAL